MDIKLLEESRRFFRFCCDKSWSFDFDDVKAEDGVLWFRRSGKYETHQMEFDSVQSCKLWALRYEAIAMEGFDANKQVDKKLYDVKSTALKMTDGEWDIVAAYMTNAERFDKDTDIKIFECFLANNFRDRDGERFPKAVLKSFEKTIVGKGKLMGHRWGDPGNGRFYHAKVKRMSVDETLSFVGSQPDKKFREHLEFIEERDGGIFWLVTRYYMPNITEMQKEAVIYIESGVWKDMSIGFRAPVKYAIFKDGKEVVYDSEEFFDQRGDNANPMLFLEFRNTKDLEAEALEGSHVFLGSQIGAQTTKSPDELEVQIKELNTKLDKVMGRLGRKKKSAAGSPQSPVRQEDGGCSMNSDQLSVDSGQADGGIEDEWVAVDSIADENIKNLVIAIDEAIAKDNESFIKMTDAEKSAELKAVWTAAYINSLEDNCFAYVEDTGKKDDEGRTIPKSARHLPHHAQGEGATGTGGTVDLPHLRNALARVNQVKPVTETISAEDLQSKARAHLTAHAKKLEIGDYDMVTEQSKGELESSEMAKSNNTNTNFNEVSKMKEFKFKSLGVELTVNDENFEETMKALQDALLEKETGFNQEMADLTQKVNDLEDKTVATEESLKTLTEANEKLDGFFKAATEVFGENMTIEDLKRAKETEMAYRDSEIKRAIKFGGSIGMIKDVSKELQRYEKYETEQITAFADKYQEDFEVRYPEYAGILKANNEELITNPDPGPKETPKVERPLQHYRW